MYLYNIECQVPNYAIRHVIVLAEDDSKAFDAAERIVRQQFITTVDITETVIVEKKPAKAGAGFVIADDTNADKDP